jgi:16S rRNA (adenine1518-N6/adenine1519-N6)-dimethyltransferase
MDARPPRPRKRFGQHFLRDATVLRRIVDAVAAEPDRPVLEIGPGRGALTERLLEAAGRVVAIEVDRDLAERLRRTFPPERLRIVQADVLEVDLAALAREEGVSRWVVAGNLPYNISKPISMRLVGFAGVVERAILMYQREVARRFVAATGSADYGPLSVLPREAYAIRKLFDVAPAAFEPPPAVVSSVVSWTAREERPSEERLEALRRVLSAVFAQRRKTLRNNVLRALGSAEILDAAGIDPGRRAQELEAEELRRLAALWPVSTG